jgi:hypothetical protein
MKRVIQRKTSVIVIVIYYLTLKNRLYTKSKKNLGQNDESVEQTEDIINQQIYYYRKE